MTENDNLPAAGQDTPGAGEADPAGEVNPAGGGEQTPGGEPIADPAAYYKAQYEKADRLLKKQNERVESLESKISGLETTQQESFKQMIADLRSEWETELAAVQQQHMDAVRKAAAAKYGLPESLAGRLSGDTEEAILADAEALAEMVGSQANNQPQAKRGNPGGGSKLTVDDVKKMSPEDVAKNWDKISEAMSSQNKT